MSQGERGSVSPKNATRAGEAVANRNGLECHSCARTAYAWCAFGSLQVSTGDENIVHSLEALMFDIVDDTYYDDAEVSKLRVLNHFNDDQASHHAVLHIFDEAIERLQNRIKWERKKLRRQGR